MRHFSNTAVETELVAAPGISGTQFLVKESNGYPKAPFTALAAPNVSGEEIVLVTATSGNTWTVVRGWGGTTALDHPPGTKIIHGAAAEDFREAAMVYQLLFGDPVYSPTDPNGLPTNPPLLDPATVVTKTGDTWGDLL